MSATNGSVLKSLEIDSAQVEALSEPDLCELIGFIEYDSRLNGDDARPSRRDEQAAAAPSLPAAVHGLPAVGHVMGGAPRGGPPARRAWGE